MELCSTLCGSLDERGVWGRMDTCVCMAEFLQCSPEIITTLLIGYIPIHNKKLKKTTAAAAKLLQSCPTLCDTIDGSPPGLEVPGIFQARTLKWVAISFSNAWKWSRSVVFDSSRPHGLQPTRPLCPRDFPGKILEWGAIYMLNSPKLHMDNIMWFN